MEEEQNINDVKEPVKIRKKPGRKPNPASPALRKAQNRAAQRAFRERKERHMRELEIAIKQIKEQRDKLHVENEQLKVNSDILQSENWYLKGIVLTLQLVCFQHNLVIPQHGPYVNEQSLSLLAQSIPEPISSYINVNANNKVPMPSKLFGCRHNVRQRDRYLSTGSILVTKEGVHSMQEQQQQKSSVSFNLVSDLTNQDTKKLNLSEDFMQPFQFDTNIPPLSPSSTEPDQPLEKYKNSPVPVAVRDEPVTSNLAAIQALRLRLRLQSACNRTDSAPFAIQPTLLQLTIPHDPRIDLIPTPHMRDRMILFRDQFDLDDCFRCLLSGSLFHGGDPAVASNWQLPAEFFEKYWFLTIDYDLRRTTNRWRRLQGLEDIDFNNEEKKEKEQTQPVLEKMPNLDYNDISAWLSTEFQKMAASQQQQENIATSCASSSSSYSSSHSLTSSINEKENDSCSIEPIRLMDGFSLSYFNTKKDRTCSENAMSPAQPPEYGLNSTWDSMLTDPMDEDYDTMMNDIIDAEQIC
ncbi:hypothetical protein G6F37_005048 [Rhizopus arrhizus]|nr:hypothetical protein G6F38_005197 [Rhizopus arrhizus]KAG1159277.1 hypothetical protein G6F37_005048 [Rhizopus arrhizus]